MSRTIAVTFDYLCPFAHNKLSLMQALIRTAS